MISTWPCHSLAEVSDSIASGLAFRRRRTGGEPTPVINVADLRDGSLAPGDGLSTALLDRGASVDRYRVREGDILVTSRGTQLRVARVESESVGAVASSNLIIVRPGPALAAPLVFALLRSPWGQAQLLSRSRSSSAAIALTAKDVGALTVPVPPVELQQQLADLVETAERVHAAATAAADLRRTVAREVVIAWLKGAVESQLHDRK